MKLHCIQCTIVPCKFLIVGLLTSKLEQSSNNAASLGHGGGFLLLKYFNNIMKRHNIVDMHATPASLKHSLLSVDVDVCMSVRMFEDKYPGN